ncbi:MAG: hypothetical protein MZV65_31620 [Chromatiales bacterium]|nr:hypothetical protein [Chromatiales bacterium]
MLPKPRARPGARCRLSPIRRQSDQRCPSGAAGLARAFGLDIDQTAPTPGTLSRYGMGAGGAGEQNKFALLLAQVIRDGGMKIAPDQVIGELQEIARHAGAPDRARTERCRARQLSALSHQHLPGLDPQGPEGAQAISSLDATFRNQGSEAQELFWAEALVQAGVTDLSAQHVVALARHLHQPRGAGHRRARLGTGCRDALRPEPVWASGPEPAQLRPRFHDGHDARHGRKAPARLAKPGAPGSPSRNITALEARGIKLDTLRPDAAAHLIDSASLDLSTEQGQSDLRDMAQALCHRHGRAESTWRTTRRRSVRRIGWAIRATRIQASRRRICCGSFRTPWPNHGQESTPAKEMRDAFKELETTLTKLGEGFSTADRADYGSGEHGDSGAAG